MGIYLNPDNINFQGHLKADIYVDKTMLIKEINRFIDKGKKYICVSRPRRFGKTMAGDMLCAYYSKGCDSRELFSGLQIAKASCFEEKLNKFNVIKFDMNGFYQTVIDRKAIFRKITEKIKLEMKEQFPDVRLLDDDSLADSMLSIYSKTGETFVLIIDEYDVLVRERVDEELLNEYLCFLNGLFKNSDLSPAISLAYITGILPMVRDKVQSKLNNFDEYTVLDSKNLSAFIGFTTDEVKRLCDEYGMDFEECRAWYDGYALRGMEIYNPKSVVEAMESGEFGNYWSKSSTYKVVSDRISQNFAGIKDAVINMISGEEVPVEVTEYMNTMTDFESLDDIFTYLIHIGYLAYNKDGKTCRIPNREIWLEWQSAIKILDNYSKTNEIIKASKELLNATLAGDEKAVEKALDESHIHVSSNRSYNNEDVLQSAIYLAYLYALNDYTIVREMTAGRGFSDVTFIPIKKENPALIIELKKNKTPLSALDQIKEKRYFDSLSHYEGNLIFVGINYDEDKKTHECRIERFKK